MTPKIMTAEGRAEQLVSKHGPFQKLSEGNSEYAIECAIKLEASLRSNAP